MFSAQENLVHDTLSVDFILIVLDRALSALTLKYDDASHKT